ncbi:MAG: HNH endonuclease, partial [Acidimicrobiia bacterium]
WYKIWGGRDGLLGAMVDGTLSEIAELCAGDDPPPAQITVFVDAEVAAANDAEVGVYLQAGPTVGGDALDAILCESVSSVIVDSEQGEPMRYGNASRSIAPALRRGIIHRDGDGCVIDGSRNRLQVHHIVPGSEHGASEPENLITFCWFHHHVAIHRLGLALSRHPEHGRWRLRRPEPSRAPPG